MISVGISHAQLFPWDSLRFSNLFMNDLTLFLDIIYDIILKWLFKQILDMDDLYYLVIDFV